MALRPDGLCYGSFEVSENIDKNSANAYQPFMINVMREQSTKISALEQDNEERKKKEASQQTIEDNTPILGNGPLMITAGPVGQAPQPYANGMAPQTTGYMF